MLYQPAEIGFGGPPHGGPTHGSMGGSPVDGAIQASAAVVLAQAIAAVRRRSRPLLLCVIGVPLLVGLALLQVEPRYTASGSVLYQPRSYANTELASILRPDPITDEVIVSQAELIRTTRAAERLVDRFNLMTRPEFNRSLRPPSLLARLRRLAADLAGEIGLGSPGDAAPVPAEEIRRSVVERVEEAIAVSPLRNSHVLGVSFTSADPDLSANAVNALMEFYISDQLEGKFEAVRSASQWLEGQAQQLQKTVADDERKIADYKARNGLTSGMVAGLSAEDVSHLGDQLVAARTELATAEARLDAARGVAAQAAVSPGVQSLRNSADTLNAQLRSLLATYGPNMPAVIRLREQVAQAYRAVDAEIGRAATAADADARAARAKVAALQQSLQTAQARSSAQAQAQVPLDSMQREAEASRALLQSVLGGLQRVSQQAAIERSDASVVSAAARPSSPSFPKTGLLLGASVVFGVCLGFLLVYLLEIVDATIGDSAELRRRLGIPCLALVPHIADQTGRTGAIAGPPGATRDGGIDDYVVRKPRSHFAEQIRAVRAAFWFASHDARTIAVTSARPGEGKTTTAIALGRSAALNGERVIVIDCDIRQPSLGEGPGISNHLRGEVRLADVTHRDPLTSLFFVPVGTPSDGGGGPFMTDGMARVLAELKQHYDLVILDSPPVLAMTDARVIARIADATLICVRWRDTPHSVAGRSLAMLQDAQAHVAGAVLTRIDPRALVRSGLADAEMYDPRYSGYYRD